MAQRSLELVLKVVRDNNREFEALQRQLQQGFQGIRLPNTGIDQQIQKTKSWVESTRDVTLAFNGALQSIQALAAGSRGIYDALIRSNEELNKQIIASAGTIAATNQVFKDGVKLGVQDSIKELQGPLRDALKQVQKDSVDLVGVTSQDISGVFQILASNASKLSEQSKTLADPLKAAGKLTIDFSAALGSLGVPLNQASQEINSILSGLIDQNSVLARRLGLQNQDVQKWKEQGVLVDKLRERLAAFTEANKQNAKSIDGITSNIKDTLQIIAREAGEPLLQPLVKGLDAVYQTIKSSQGDIQTLANTLTSVFNDTAQSIAQSLQPVFEQLGAVLQNLGPLTANFFTLFSNGLKASFDALQPVLVGVGQLTAKVTEGLNNLSELILLKQINDAQDALNEINKTSDEISNKAVETTSSLNALAEARKKGSITPEQLEREKQLKAQAKQQIALLDDQIARYKAIASVNPQVAANQQATINGLLKVRDALAGSSGQVKIAAQPLQDLGNSYAQLAKQAAQAEKVLKSGGAQDQAANFQKSAGELVKITQQQLELGQISEKEAQKRLQSIASNSKVEVAQQQAAQEALSKIRKVGLDRSLKDLDIQSQAIQNKVKSGQITEVQGVEETTKLKQQQYQLQLADLQKSIAEEQKAISGGSGSKSRLAQLQQQQRQLQQQSEAETIASADRIEKLRIDAIERTEAKATKAAKEAETSRQIETQKLINAGVIRKEEADQRRLASVRKTISAELEAEKASLKALQALPKANDPGQERERQNKIAESRTRVSDLTLKLLENEKQQQEAVTAAVQARIDRQLKGELNALNEQKLPLEALQLAQEGISKSIENRLNILKAEQDVLRANADLSKSQYDNAVKLLESAGAEEDRLRDAQQRRIDLQKRLSTAKSPDEVASILKEIAETDRKAKREAEIRNIKIEAKRAEIAAAEREFQLQDQSLALEEQKTKLINEQEATKLRISKIEAEANVAEKEAEAARVAARKDSTPEERRAAQLGVRAARARLTGVDQQIEIQRQSSANTEQLAAARRTQQSAQQGQRLAGLQTELAGLTPGAQDDRALSQVQLQRARAFTPGVPQSALTQPGNVVPLTSQTNVVDMGSLITEVRALRSDLKAARPLDVTVNNQISGQKLDEATLANMASRQTVDLLTRSLKAI